MVFFLGMKIFINNDGLQVCWNNKHEVERLYDEDYRDSSHIEEICKSCGDVCFFNMRKSQNIFEEITEKIYVDVDGKIRRKLKNTSLIQELI